MLKNFRVHALCFLKAIWLVMELLYKGMCDLGYSLTENLPKKEDFGTTWHGIKDKEYIRKSEWSVGIYLLKVNNRNTRTRCEICSKLTIKAPECRSGVFIVNIEHISHLPLVFLLLTLNI